MSAFAGQMLPELALSQLAHSDFMLHSGLFYMLMSVL